MDEATQSYRERMKAQRAEARAKRDADKAEWHRRIELHVEVRRIAMAATKAAIRDKGDKLSLYSPAQLRTQADAMIGPWLVAQAKATACDAGAFVERNSCTEWSGKMIVGYARVSTDGQTLEAQQAALAAVGAERVFAEKQSGIKTDRAALARCMRSLEAGDVLLVTKLDRLARSTRDLLNTLEAISDKGASFKSLGDPWADTTTPHGKLMITILGGLAEFERHLILSRTKEGRQRPMAKGIKFGRKPKLTRHQREEAKARKRKGSR